jgi:hypothetical protein
LISTSNPDGADLPGGTAWLNGRDLAGYDPDGVRAVITGCWITR